MHITTIAPNPGPRGLPVIFGYHEFGPTEDLQLGHWIDGQLRATVPPEGWASYVTAWPQCAEVVRSMTLAPKLDLTAVTAAAANALRHAPPL
jgi:hypothetical protein